MNAWLLFLQMLATAQALSQRTGYRMTDCAAAIDGLFVAYHDDPKSARYFGTTTIPKENPST